MIREIDEKTIEHCTENSKEIFGSKKNDKVVAASLNKGKLEKYSKSDTDKKEPYSTMKAPVYEKNGGYNIAFEAYRSIDPIDGYGEVEIQNIPLTQPEDLMEVFHSGANVLPIVKIRGSYVDKRIILSTTVAQCLIVPNKVESGIPFADTAEEDMVSVSFAAQEEFKQAALEAAEALGETNEPDEPMETKKPVENKVDEKETKMEETPEPKPSTPKKVDTEKDTVESDDESDDEEEEEEEEDSE